MICILLNKELVKKSTEAYESAYKIILDELSPVDPIRLGMALSQSTFLYEIAGLPDKAVSIAKNVFKNLEIFEGFIPV